MVPDEYQGINIMHALWPSTDVPAELFKYQPSFSSTVQVPAKIDEQDPLQIVRAIRAKES